MFPGPVRVQATNDCPLCNLTEPESLCKEIWEKCPSLDVESSEMRRDSKDLLMSLQTVVSENIGGSFFSGFH